MMETTIQPNTVRQHRKMVNSNMSRKRRRKQDGYPPASFAPTWMSPAALITTLLLLPSLSAAQKFDLCLSTLQTSDLDSNNILTSFEFNSAVSKFSGGTLNELSVVWDQYNNNNVVRYIPIVGSKNLQDLCDDIFDGILGDYRQNCVTSLNFGDSNRDKQISEAEFPKFAIQLAGWDADTELPSAVQSVYDDFEVIDVISPVADFTESAKAVCRHTAIAALMNSSATAPTTAPTSGTGAIMSNLPTGFTPTINQAMCERMMAFSDLSRDNRLNEDEYYRFVVRLDTTLEDYSSYSALPAVLQETYGQLSESKGSIDVFGSKPGQTKTAAATQNLSSICAWTEYAIQTALENAPPPTTTATTAAPTASPAGIEFRKCLTDMIVADLSRDSLLDQQEYVRFIARNDDDVDFKDSFANLTEALQRNFHDLAKDGLVDVTGSKPNQTPTAEQNKHLRNICQMTGAALKKDLEGEAASVTVYNSFTISNDRGIMASGYTSTDKEDLQVAYTEFLTQVLRNYTGNANLQIPRKNLRARRLLTITSIPTVPTIDSFYDAICPAGVSAQKSCATVFGSFDVEFLSDESSESLATQLSQVIQKQIDPVLTTIWSSSNGTRTFNIEGPSFPADPSKANHRPFGHTNSNTAPPIGPIMAGLSISLIVFGGAIYFWKTNRKLPGCSRQKKSNKDETRMGSELSQDDDNEMIPYGVESAPSVNYGLDKDDENEGSSESENEDGSVDFSVEEEQLEGEGRGGQNVFNAFRRGKKKHSTVEDDIKILEGDDDGFQVNGEDDFVHYAFEEPTELKQTKNDGFGDQNWAGAATGNAGWSEWGVVATSNAFKNNDTFVNNDENDDSDDESSSESENGSESNSSGADSKMSAGSKVSVLSGQSTVIDQMGVIDNGDWNSFVENGSDMGGRLDESETEVKEDKSFTGSHGSVSSSSNGSMNDGFASGDVFGSATITSEEKRDEEFREQVEKLVRRACPDEFENIGSMMVQFAGRETELINTLQTLADRKDSQRRLKAVHKSKAIREREIAGYTSGGAEGSAVIAAASMINSDANDASFDDQDSFDEDDSYYSEDRSGSRSYSDEYDDQGSYSGSRTGSHDEGSYTGSRGGSYDDDRSHTGSRSGSYSDRDGSYTEGTNNFDDEGSYSRSQNGEDDRSHSGSQSYTGSYSGSYSRSHSGSRSYSGSGSGSYDDEGSFYGD